MPGLDVYRGQRVVLDTAGPTIYIGSLEEYDDAGFWLRDADVHDRNDGYSTKEEYVSEACHLERNGDRRVNRKRVFVDRRAVISVSALADVMISDLDEDDATPRSAT